MQIYGRDVPSSDEIWQLYSQIVLTPDLWNAETFTQAAKQCGLRKIAARKTSFSFSGKHHLTGQAPIVEGLIEEVRLFIGNEPRDLSEALFEKDRQKIGQVASEYSTRFRQELGEPRTMYNNDIFEYNDHRLRVLPTGCVWVVVSNLSILKRLSTDPWKPA